MKIVSHIILGLVFVVQTFAFLPAAWGQDDQGGQVRGFQLPADENTYVVTYNLRGLTCVQDVGTPTQCAVPNQAADEGGYPWTKVKCKQGDVGISNFAWSLDNNQPMGIFEAPPSLVTSAKTYSVNVRLGRVCMRSGK